VVDLANTEAVPILRLNGEVPGAGGTWTIGGVTIGATALTIEQIPSHTHVVPGFVTGGAVSAFQSSGNVARNGDLPTDATGGSATHTHTFVQDGTWRPKYLDQILCSKE
jgi:hypothetical protein